MDGEDQLALLLIALAGIGAITTIILVRAARRTHWPALEERAGLSTGLSFLRVGLAGLSLLHLIRADADPYIVGGLIVLIFVFIGVVDLIWLGLYLGGRFNAQ